MLPKPGATRGAPQLVSMASLLFLSLSSAISDRHTASQFMVELADSKRIDEFQQKVALHHDGLPLSKGRSWLILSGVSQGFRRHSLKMRPLPGKQEKSAGLAPPDLAIQNRIASPCTSKMPRVTRFPRPF